MMPDTPVRNADLGWRLFDSIVIPALVIDKTGFMRYMNQQAESLYGYTAIEVVGRHCQVLAARDQSELLNSILKDLFEVGQSALLMEKRLQGRRKDGSNFSCELAVTAVATPDELLYLVTIREMTASELLEQELATLKTAIDQSRDAVAIFSRNDRSFRYVNQAGYELLGYSAQDFVAMGVADVRPDISDADWAVLDQLKATERQSVLVKTALTHKDGHRVPVEIMLQPVAGDDDSEDYIAVTRDNTAHLALVNELSMVKSAVDQSSDGVYIFSGSDGRLTYANEAARLQWGMSMEELLNRRLDDFRLYHHEQDADTQAIDNLVACKTDSAMFQALISHEDGHDVEIDILLQRVQVERGDENLIAIARDNSAQKALVKELSQVKTAIDQSRDAVFIFDMDSGQMLYVNRILCEKLGYTEQELLSRVVADIRYEPHIPEYLSIFRDIESGRTQSALMDTYLIGKDGRKASVELAFQAVESEVGARNFLISARDNSERIRLVHELATFKAGIDQTRDSIAMFTWPGGEISYANRAVAVQMGYSPEEIRGMTIDFIRQDLSDREREILASLIKGDIESHILETELVHKDGTIVPYEVMLQMLAYEDDQAPQVLAVMRDITVRRAEQRQRLEEEEYQRAIVDYTVDGLISIDEWGIVESFNNAASRMFGYAPDEVLGRNVNMLMPEPYAAGHDGYLSRYRETGIAGIIGVGRELVAKRKDGSIFPIDLGVAEINLPHRRFFSGVVRDITQRKAIETDLVQARDNAEKANTAKSAFLSRMSHELRTPLNSILGYAQLLEIEPLQEHSKQDVERILGAGSHLLALINEVLDIARVESGRVSLSLEPVCLRDVVGDAWQLIKPLADKRSITLVSDEAHGQGDLFVLADTQRLRQVVLNFLSNAVKYNFESGTITTYCTDSDHGIIRLVVEDSGPGIPPDKQEFIFEPFARLEGSEQSTADSTETEGTGVGLAHSRALMESMGGKIGVDSDGENGSKFWLTLPLIEKPESWQRVVNIDPDGANSDFGDKEKQGRVLYIEDSLANTRLIEMVFRYFPGIELESCGQGRLGIELAQSFAPDLILLDLSLPDIDGLEVLARLKNDPATSNIRVVIISADALADGGARLTDAGAHRYLSKPFDLAELAALVDDVL